MNHLREKARTRRQFKRVVRGITGHPVKLLYIVHTYIKYIYIYIYIHVYICIVHTVNKDHGADVVYITLRFNVLRVLISHWYDVQPLS